MLSVRGLKKHFGDLQVLKGIDLEVSDGDVVSILGPSGSGKTTLLRCLEFLERADEGELTPTIHTSAFLMPIASASCRSAAAAASSFRITAYFAIAPRWRTSVKD